MRTANKIKPAAGTVAGKHRMRRRCQRVAVLTAPGVVGECGCHTLLVQRGLRVLLATGVDGWPGGCCGRGRCWAAAAAALVVLLGAVVGGGGPAAAAGSSGGGGLLVFVRDGDLYTASPVTGQVLDRLTFNGYNLDPEWSPDATRIAFSRFGTLYVMNADGTRVRPVPTGMASGSWDPTWSPSGKRLAFTGQRDRLQVYRVRVDGSRAPVELTDQNQPGEPGCGGAQPSWAPTGRRIAFLQSCDVGAEPDGLRIGVVNARTKHVRIVTYVLANTIRTPSWRPDGRSLLFASNCPRPASSDCSSDTEAVEINLDGTGWTVLTEHGRSVDYPVSSPDGLTFAYALYIDTVPTVRVADRAEIALPGTQVDWQPVQ